MRQVTPVPQVTRVMEQLPRRTAWTLTLVATSTMAVSYLDRQALSVLAPSICRELHMTDSAYAVLASAFSVAYLLCAPGAGAMIDSIGARRGLPSAVLAWSVVSALHALVPGFAVLFALRILLGMAEAPSFPGAAQTVSRALAPADRNAGFGILFTGSSLGAAIAAALVPKLASAWGWRGAMLLTAAVGLSWIPLWLFVTRDPAVRRRLATETAMATEMEMEMEGAEPIPPADVPHIEHTKHTGHIKHRLHAHTAQAPHFLSLLGDPAVLRAMLAVIASAPTVAFSLLWGAKILDRMHAVAQANVGHYLWLPPLLFDVGAVSFGALATFRERRAKGPVEHRVLFAAAALSSLSVGAIAYTSTAWETTLALGGGVFGAGAIFALVTAEMLRRVAPSRVAAAGGMTAAAQSLAYIIANPLVGWTADHTPGYGTAALGLALWTLPGCLAWLFFPDFPGDARTGAAATSRTKS